jgi:hypothetical protein
MSNSSSSSVTELQKINDSIESLNIKIDKFYHWASQLQVEFRDMKRRVEFIEDAIDPFCKPSFSLSQARIIPSLEQAGNNNTEEEEDDTHCQCGDSEEELIARLNALRC